MKQKRVNKSCSKHRRLLLLVAATHLTILFHCLPVQAAFVNENLEQREISGIVKDQKGMPLPGVSIVVKGTSHGTITSDDGSFKISADITNTSVLKVSFIGMLTQEITIGEKSFFEIILQEDYYDIDELVVVGYGYQKENKITGAISNIKMESIEGRPLTNISQALSGAASGVQITQGSSQPGSDGVEIRIRGIGTLTSAGQGPLILVDGIASSMYGLEPTDIENITVLKDAASAAIYGSRAANGVILVTTKKGSRNKTNISYNYYYGLQSPTRMMDLITDMTTHMELLNEAKTNIMGAGSVQFPLEEIEAYKTGVDPLLYPNTNWFDYFYGTPRPIQKHNLSASGGSENVLYNLSFGYLNQEGVGSINSMGRINFRTNLEADLSDRLKVGVILSGFRENIDGPTNIASAINDWATSPGIAVQNDDGQYGGPQVIGEGYAGNPLAVLNAVNKTNTYSEYNAKVFMEYEILSSLKLQSNVAMKHADRVVESLSQPYELYNFRDSTVSLSSPATTISLYNQNTQGLYLTTYTTLNYQESFGDHYINALAGYSFESGESKYMNASISDLYSIATPVLSAGTSEPTVNGGKSEWGLISYFGRINYDYQEKYLAEANVRMDGSSKFKEGNRWATFPSFSAGWRLSKEAFFPQNTFVSDLKLRASWGMLGNQNIGDNYPYQAVYSLVERYNFNGAVVDGAAVTDMANDNISWETTTSTNLALDLSLFKNRFNATFDWFTRLTDDILVQLPIPLTLGAKNAPYQNIAQVKNWGWELETSYRQKINELFFQVSANFTQIENLVVKYKGEVPSINGVFIIAEGLPYNSLYGYQCEGIFQSWDEVNESAIQHDILTAPGDLKYENYDDSDDRINAEDRQVIGNTIPKYYFGFSFNMNYKGFDINAILQGVAKVDRYLSMQNVFPFATNDRGLTPTKWEDRWTEENPSTTIPRLTIRGDYSWNYANSSYWVQDGSYLRLKNFQIGYTFPKRFFKKLNITNIRTYVNGQNLLTFTNYEGYDPETTATQTTVGYPHTKVMSFGIQVNF